LAGVALGAGGDLLGRAGHHDAATTGTAFGAEVDEPVGAFQDIEVVFDDQHRVTGIDQALKGQEEDADIFEVQAGGGFVEDEEGGFGVGCGGFRGGRRARRAGWAVGA
jgi:hypothetical protein